MQFKAKWIKPQNDYLDVCPVFTKEFSSKGQIKKAALTMTAMGVYETMLNGKRVSDYVLAPGFTSYQKRHQYQVYDVTEFLSNNNKIEITVGKGWYRSRMPGWTSKEATERRNNIPAGLLVQLSIEYMDSTTEDICSDSTWFVGESPVRLSEIYDGEVYDATFTSVCDQPAQELDLSYDNLIEQEGEYIKEQEHIKPITCFTTPKGERVIDFGQNLTGYVELTLNGKAGDQIEISHAEVMDKEGNFYTENYRGAKSKLVYTCKDGLQTYKPKFTFFGFRYIRLDQFPGEIDPNQFTAIVVHSDMKRTGYLKCSNSLLNQLFENVVWGQKGNFLDVPTDCPQRDERLGWTGDAQVFVKTASYNYDVEKFFIKWMKDLEADQRENGAVTHVVPDLLNGESGSAAWGDAATICPWQIYLTYGDKKILKNQYNSMKRWVDFITNHTKEKDLWIGGGHFGDWCALDGPIGTNTSYSDKDFIASAFYAYSTSLITKAGKVLGENVAEYEELYHHIVKAFRERFPKYTTQTEHVLAIYFNLATDCQRTADDLAKMIHEGGNHLKTGFVGTPYLLHVLSDYGHTDLAYTLLMRKEYPSWLFSVTKGATTIWEHWDGIMENGDFWNKDMNSFNHYAYGSVADWVYEVAAGINLVEEHPGFEKILFKPQPDSRLEWLDVLLETRHGKVSSKWRYIDGKVRYEIETPTAATIIIGENEYQVEKGKYIF